MSNENKLFNDLLVQAHEQLQKENEDFSNKLSLVEDCKKRLIEKINELHLIVNRKIQEKNELFHEVNSLETERDIYKFRLDDTQKRLDLKIEELEKIKKESSLKDINGDAIQLARDILIKNFGPKCNVTFFDDVIQAAVAIYKNTKNELDDYKNKVEKLQGKKDSLVGWWVIKEYEDGSLILENHTGDRKHVWNDSSKTNLIQINNSHRVFFTLIKDAIMQPAMPNLAERIEEHLRETEIK